MIVNQVFFHEKHLQVKLKFKLTQKYFSRFFFYETEILALAFKYKYLPFIDFNIILDNFHSDSKDL